jgi:hypothetical protein
MSNSSYWYEIWVEEALDSRWSPWFSNMEILPTDLQTTVGTMLRGRLPDQAALFGLLGRIRDLNLTLIEVKRIGETSKTSTMQNRRK